MSEDQVRDRILEAAFVAFSEHGYAAASTAEIAARARVSKRELYALVGNKQAMLSAGIGERAKRLHLPADLPPVRDRATLSQVLRTFGAQLLREVSDPTVIAAFRLAIAEAPRAPEVAQTLDAIGRGAAHAALCDIMAQAKKCGMLSGRPTDLAGVFRALLFGDLLITLLLGVSSRPSLREAEKRSDEAAAAFLQLHAV